MPVQLQLQNPPFPHHEARMKSREASRGEGISGRMDRRGQAGTRRYTRSADQHQRPTVQKPRAQTSDADPEKSQRQRPMREVISSKSELVLAWAGESQFICVVRLVGPGRVPVSKCHSFNHQNRHDRPSEDQPTDAFLSRRRHRSLARAVVSTVTPRNGNRTLAEARLRLAIAACTNRRSVRPRRPSSSSSTPTTTETTTATRTDMTRHRRSAHRRSDRRRSDRRRSDKRRLLSDKHRHRAVMAVVCSTRQ